MLSSDSQLYNLFLLGWKAPTAIIILYDEKLLNKQKYFYKVEAKIQGKIVEIEECLLF